MIEFSLTISWQVMVRGQSDPYHKATHATKWSTSQGTHVTKQIMLQSDQSHKATPFKGSQRDPCQKTTHDTKRPMKLDVAKQPISQNIPFPCIIKHSTYFLFFFSNDKEKCAVLSSFTCLLGRENDLKKVCTPSGKFSYFGRFVMWDTLSYVSLCDMGCFVTWAISLCDMSCFVTCVPL